MGKIYIFVNKEKNYIKYGETIQEVEERISQHEEKTGGAAIDYYYFMVYEEDRYEIENLIKQQLKYAGFKPKKGTTEFHHLKDSKAVTQAFLNVYEFYQQLLEFGKNQIIDKNKSRCKNCKRKLNYEPTIFDKYCDKCIINLMSINKIIN
jgi:hypothetical protein